LVNFLKEEGIPTGVYYPIPGHRQAAFASFHLPEAFPISDRLAKRVLSLPMHTELNESQQLVISQALIKFVLQ
jgi:dTDP-4-amino-4,6-dideoxygalactose transaminase